MRETKNLLAPKGLIEGEHPKQVPERESPQEKSAVASKSPPLHPFSKLPEGGLQEKRNKQRQMWRPGDTRECQEVTVLGSQG